MGIDDRQGRRQEKGHRDTRQQLVDIRRNSFPVSIERPQATKWTRRTHNERSGGVYSRGSACPSSRHQPTEKEWSDYSAVNVGPVSTTLETAIHPNDHRIRPAAP
jgi:hypothetical protein